MTVGFLAVAAAFTGIGLFVVGNVWSGLAIGILMGAGFAAQTARAIDERRDPNFKNSESVSKARVTWFEALLILGGVALAVDLGLAGKWTGVATACVFPALGLGLSAARFLIRSGRVGS